MQTHELEANLRTLDQTVIRLGQAVQNMRNSINQYYSEAYSLENAANQLLSMASSEEDPERVSQIYSQASSYMNQAESYRMQAQQVESQIGERATELRAYKSEYQYYLNEGQTNLANLKIAADTLLNVSGSKYGADKLKAALAQTNQRIIYNQNLIKGCQTRMNWIDQICGSDGDPQLVKVKRR